jgi:hypothetical protein
MVQLFYKIKRSKFMKKLVYSIVSVSIFSLLIISCNKDDISVDKSSALSSAKTEDSPIANAEKELGKLVKRDIIYKDISGTSSFTLRFAAKTEEQIDSYLSENTISFFAISAKEKSEKYKNVSPRAEVNSEKEESFKVTVNAKATFTELISKKLAEGMVGYGMTIAPKSTKNIDGKNLKVSDNYDIYGNYYREAPFAWAELCDVYCYENTGQYADGVMQKRGLFWNTWFGLPLAPGLGQVFNVDGPKYTRIGSAGWYRPYYQVTWIDFESGQSGTSAG